MKKIIRLIIFITILCNLDGKVLDGSKFMSPDNEFVATIIKNGYSQNIEVTNLSNGKIIGNIETGTIIESLQWLPQSKGIVTVRHMAKESYCTVNYLDKFKITEKTYVPEIKTSEKHKAFVYSSVDNIKILDDYLEITYESSIESRDGLNEKNIESIIKVNTSSKKYTITEK